MGAGGQRAGAFPSPAAGAAQAAGPLGLCNGAPLKYSGTGTVNLNYDGAGEPLNPEAIRWFRDQYGLTVPGGYALAAQRHMYEFATTSAQLAEIKVAASTHAQHNPNAFLRDVAGRVVSVAIWLTILSVPLGGLLIYETFTRAQAERGKPTNPDFLLEPGELRELVHPFEVLVEREGDFEGKMLASVIARRPPAPARP